MYTSYYEGFTKIQPFIKNVGVSISGKAPEYFKGSEFTALRAEWFFLNQYKIDHDEKAYTKQYCRNVLTKFTPQVLYHILCNEFGMDSVLLCYEPPGEFCHRRLVAEYLQRTLGVRVPELDIKTIEIKAKNKTLDLKKELPTLEI